jgi:6-phosphogluconolactonase
LLGTIYLCTGADELARRSAERIIELARNAVAQRGLFTIALSGGETPASTYRLLGGELARSIPWERVHVFWGDERCIPLHRPDNHFTMATELMLSHVPIPPENIHRAHGESDDTPAAAAQYEAEMRDFFGDQRTPFPEFDLVLLGMGEDGHIASLFPGSDGLAQRDRWVADHYVIKRGERVRRLTLTMPVLVAARDVMVLVSGSLKAEMLRAVIEARPDVPAAELAAKAANICWMIDREAAAALDRTAMTGEDDAL